MPSIAQSTDSEALSNSLWIFLGRCSSLSRNGKKNHGFQAGPVHRHPTLLKRQNGNSLLPHQYQDLHMRYWPLRMFSGDCGLTMSSLMSLTANETVVLLSLWLTQNLGQLTALMCNHWKSPSEMKTIYLVMKNIFSWSVFLLLFFSFFPQTSKFWWSLRLQKQAQLSHSSAPLPHVWVWLFLESTDSTEHVSYQCS